MTDGEPATGPFPTLRAFVPVLALIVSALAVLGSTVWSRGFQREDAIRAERRLAYSTFLGAVERCGPNNSAILTQAEALRTSSLTAEERATQLADFEARLVSEQAGCITDLGVGEATLFLLADDEEELVEISARQLRDSTRLVRAALVREARSLVEGRPVQASPPSCEEPVNDDDPPEPLSFPVDVSDDLAACGAWQQEDYRLFRGVAQLDVQEPAPGVGEWMDKHGWKLFLGAIVVLAVVGLYAAYKVWRVYREIYRQIAPMVNAAHDAAAEAYEPPPSADASDSTPDTTRVTRPPATG